MSAPFLPAIDIRNFANDPGLSVEALSYFGQVFATATQDNIDDAFVYLQQTFGQFSTFFDCTALSSIDDVVSLLDSGAIKVFVTKDQLARLEMTDNVDRSRLVLTVETLDSTSDASSADALFVRTYSVATLEAASKRTIYTLFADGVENALFAAKAGAVLVITTTSLTSDPTNEPNAISCSDLLLARVQSDRPDGLISTVVTDERGIALGLVYSSTESVKESIRTGRGVYHSRKRGLWYKGESSGDIQELVRIELDCDSDCLRFAVKQKGRGFCHLARATCFGEYTGLSRLQQTLQRRKASAPQGSYTARLFNDPELLKAKIVEEAEELCEAKSKKEIAFEAADLLYFALAKCVAAGVSLEEVEQDLDAKSVKIRRRKGDAKPGAMKATSGLAGPSTAINGQDSKSTQASNGVSSREGEVHRRIEMRRYVTSESPAEVIQDALQRPSQRSMDAIIGIVKPIIDNVRSRGDDAVLEYTHKFEKATSLTSPVLKAPFPQSLMQLSPETIKAIDTSYENIRKFHSAQKEEKPLRVETMPGVVCSRFSRPIERVGLYVPGGTAVLPSTALMLGVPAMVAGCRRIVMASPPRADGSISPEIVYIAHKVGAESIVLAGGAQAVAAMAYGTQNVSKVDKILGPGNQFVTAAKMLVSNDTLARVSIDMPAGPSEVLVIADASANPAFVASDLLSQAEHGPDSQVVLIAVALDEQQLRAIEDEVHKQAMALPRVKIVRQAIDHSVTLVVRDVQEAMRYSNEYAPEHLILQVEKAHEVSKMVENAGSVFIGPWTPESVGDYSAGVNHSLRE